MQSADEDMESPEVGEVAFPCDDGLPTETAGVRGFGDVEVVTAKEVLQRRKRKMLKGRKNRISLSSSVDQIPKEFEVERIVDYGYDYHQHWYLVKWKGWKSKYNSWEPLNHLENSQLLVEEFHRKAQVSLAAAMRNQDARKLEIETVMGRNAEINFARADLEKIMMKLNGFPELPSAAEIEKCFINLRKRKSNEKMKRVNPVLASWALAKAREEQVLKLSAWEEEINQKCSDPAPITVCNDVDLENPPEGFNYINYYLPFPGVVIPSEPIVGCDCGYECTPNKGCCPNQAGTTFPYTSEKLLNIQQGQPIYECNSRCSCSSSCPNRVVQLGRQFPLCIFRTRNGCGWGVRAVHKIPKGSFVCEYVGEVLMNNEAEKRGREYDLEGRTYLFDLDYNQTEESECMYTVDAAKHGNISHFINHSCNPNLQVYAVWIECLDPNLPRLGLFSCRNISAGEEVTFDYSPHYRHGQAVKTIGMQPKCKCGSKMCRKVFLW